MLHQTSGRPAGHTGFKRPWLLTLLCLFLMGCTAEENTLDYRYRDYLDRVENLLERDAVPLSEFSAIRYPARRERLRELPVFEQGLVEVWDFERCGLMHLINQRNSNLGKVMPASQRFLYENHFWQKLEPCYQERQKWLTEDPDFVKRLEDTYQHKQLIAPGVLHQLFFSGQELESQFSQTQQAFAPDKRPEYRTVAQALDYLADLQPRYRSEKVDPEVLEQHLQALNQQAILHSLLKSLQVSTLRLNQIADLIQQKLDQRPICLSGGSTPRAKALFNVLQKFYLQGIQPVIAHHSRMANQLLPPLNRIFQLSEPDSSLAGYHGRWLSMQQEGGLWQRFRAANQHHTEQWNRLLRQCGLFPR